MTSYICSIVKMRVKTKASEEPPVRNQPLNLPRPKHCHRFTLPSPPWGMAKMHAVLHIYRSNLRNTRSKQASPSRYYFSVLRYQEAVKKMIDPESWRHTVAVYSSRFKIIACFPPPIFCLSTAIISAILAAPYSADGSHCLLLLRSPQTGFKAVLLGNNGILKEVWGGLQMCMCVCFDGVWGAWSAANRRLLMSANAPRKYALIFLFFVVPFRLHLCYATRETNNPLRETMR